MLNRMFMFHYKLNQNTGCKVKFAVNMIEQAAKDIIESLLKWAAISLAPSLPPRYPANDAELTSESYPEFTPGLEVSRRLFFLNPAVTRFVHYPWFVVSKTGHQCSQYWLSLTKQFFLITTKWFARFQYLCRSTKDSINESNFFLTVQNLHQLKPVALWQGVG